ncbi:histidine kinase [Paenibacillus thalictri]|uniref:HAMP domain-containing protein n=1 Tax=Paenibacillus thalictri TaxID=2527873 RepID=A0A4Q9DH30_9BACL|nr:histidine kinase [Paenibacillus thalictri]TBL71104.1 HAMP domain-containing protein [Paenibacillus thalictri]
MISESLDWLNRRLKISTKIFFITFLLIVALILTSTFFFQQKASGTLLFAQTEFAKQLIAKSDDYLQLNLRSMRSFFLSVAGDKRLQSGNYEQIQTWMNDNLILYFPNAKNIHLLKGNIIVASTTPNNWLLDDNLDFQENRKDIKVPYELYWSKPYYSPVSNYTITAMMEIPDFSGTPYTLALDLDFAGFYKSIFPTDSASLQGQLLLLDRANQPIYGTSPYMSYNVFTRKYELNLLSPEWFDQNWGTYETRQNSLDLLLVRKQNDLVGWQEIWVLDRKELLTPLQKGMSSNWLLISLSCVLALFISFMISIFIGSPIKKIARSMDEISLGQWNTTIKEVRHDELGILAKHFNHMTKKIRNLIDDLQLKEAEKKESDFRALQSQIRPHFLYNTLNLIGAAARKEQFDKVDAMISSLIETLQYSIDLSPMPLTFQEELLSVQHYIHLMQIRYETHFSIEMDIDPYTQSLLLPKFTLQPLTENSIFHGIVPDNQPGVLFIGTTFHGDSWDIIIEDSGIGIEPEKLAAIIQSLDRQRTDEHEHIGLYSVHNRLKIMFGDAYHIQMASTVREGTRIILTLPALSRGSKEADHYADPIAG